MGIFNLDIFVVGDVMEVNFNFMKEYVYMLLVLYVIW